MRLWLTRGKSLSLILVALMLWHFEGIWLYAQSRATQRQQEATADRTASLSKAFNGNRFDALLSDLKETVKRGAAKTKSTPEKGFAEIGKLTELKEKLIKEDEKNLQYFSQLEEVIKQKGLPEEILNRHRQFVRDYSARYEALMNSLEGIESAHKDATGFWGTLTGKSKQVEWDGVIGKLSSFLEENSPRQQKQQFDPHNLPHRSLKADKAIPPKLTREEWLKAFPQESLEAGPKFAHVAKVKNPFVVLQTAPPTDADLAETIEVQFTPEIRQLAESLGKNPVKIFNWVRNNIEFVPTWGSIQGAQLCMQGKSCNAFDTASLLIALLRVSGIPARYQMGTIEVPIAKLMNWTGGFTSADAAASLFASGGVPSVVRRVDPNGKVVSVKLEHIWVKAFVDYAPSGGAVNIRDNTWVELDASFKQYNYISRTDYRSSLSTDPQTLLTQLLAGAIINKDIDSVTKIDNALLNSTISTTASRIEQTQVGLSPEQIVTNLLGSKKTQQVNLALLVPNLPYKRLVTGSSFSSIPLNLRHALSLKLEDQFANVLISFTQSLPEIGGKRLALNYVVASDKDSKALAALTLNGSFQFPSSISLKPEFRLNEQTISSGDPIGFGNSQMLKLSFSAPTINTPEIVKPITVGEQIAIGLDLGQISSTQLAEDAAYFQNVKDLIDSNNLSASEITRQKVGERMLNQMIWTWFFRTDLASTIAADQMDAVTLRYPSAGLCFYDLKPATLFGATLGAKFAALGLDVDRDVVITMSRSGKADDARRLSEIQGNFGSALESLVLDQFFSQVPGKPEWGSTTTLLGMANNQGIPVINVNQTNITTTLPVLNLSQDIKDEINDAINAGLVVTVPQQEIAVLRYRGVGYIVEDPRTGSAAYLISGGLNGAAYLGEGDEGGTCDATSSSKPPDGRVMPTGIPQSCIDFLEKQKSLLISICGALIGGVGGPIATVLNLLLQFINALECLAKQGKSLADILPNLFGIVLIAVGAFLVIGVMLATAPETAGLSTFLFGSILKFIVGLIANTAMQKIAGCT